MKNNIYVVAAVIVRAGKVFCAQRSPAQSLPNKWEFPGGKIEKGETDQIALKREIKEEIKSEIEVGNKVEYTIYEYDFGIVHLTTYYCSLLSGEPLLTEHSAAKWVRPENLLHLDWAPADIPAIKKIKGDLEN